MAGVRAAVALACSWFLFAAPALAQDEPAPEEIRSDTDPTKPVLLSLREEYYDLIGDSFQNVVIVRADRFVLNRVALPGRSRGLLLRGDLPIVTVGDGDTRRSGLGDLYAQALVVPRLSPSFTIVWGAGMVLPTATNSVGSGQFQLAPAVAPIWFFGRLRGFAYVKLQDFISVAGTDDRPEIHYFLATPTLLWRLSRTMWTVVDSESRTDWKRDNITSFRSGFQIGKMWSPRFGTAAKVEIPWGPHRLGSWTLKLTAFFTRY